jgi:hypothetical protein
MKRILLALAIVTLVLPAAQQVRAETEVSISYFYDNLNDGNWIEVGDYGYCWQPNVASSADWRPYTDGYWAYTDVGWTWVSYEDFGWATYHYGRWVRLEDQGWLWVPGYEWGPAWVSWRTGGDAIGWAPLPPTRERIYEGRAITGHVDVEFDIGPLYYNFVDVRYIGEPVLRDRIYPVTQNITVINNTVNVTNITYRNSVVYNHGPDIERLNQYSVRPIQRLKLERTTNVNVTNGVRGSEVTKVQGGTLMVAAPVKIQKPAKNVAPKNVKTKIAQAKIEHGWSGVSDPKVKSELVQKMKTEDSKNIPPPSTAPAQKPGAAAGASPAVGASPATGASPVATAPPAEGTPAAASPAPTPEKGKQKGKRGEPAAATPAVSPSVAGEQGEATPSERGRGRGRHGKPGEQAAPTPESAMQKGLESPSATGEASPRERGKGRKGRQGEEPAVTPKAETPSAREHNAATGLAPEATQPSKQKGNRRHEEATPTPSTGGGASNEPETPRHHGKHELAPSGQSANDEAVRGPRNRPTGRVQEQPATGAGTGEGKKEGGPHKKKGAEPSPTP